MTTPSGLYEQASNLVRLYEAAHHPFPYDGCRKLLSVDDDKYAGLIPDLDLYFSNIASHAGGSRKVLQWPQEKVQKALGGLSVQFFQKHPEYKPLESLITPAYTPDLYADVVLYEDMRQRLLLLLTGLLNSDKVL